MPAPIKIADDAQAPSALFSKSTGLLFEIRPPQRRFKWKKEQVKQLWDDILTAHTKGRGPYFLGTLLLARLGDSQDGSGRVSVIDGQQRITALSLLLAVLRDSCIEHPEYDMQFRVTTLQNLISRLDNYGKPLDPLVVTLQEPDNQTYVELVKEPRSTTSVPLQNGLLTLAVSTLKRGVQEHINKGNDPKESLHKLCDYVQDSITLLPIEVRNEGEGYLVFDTTNTRGLRLSSSESLKARLATTARENDALSEELIRQWNDAARKLEDATQSIDAMDDYLHAVWTSEHGYTTKRTLDRIASKLASVDRLTSFVNDLKAYCDSYLAVVAPKGQSSISEDLRDLKGLNVQANGFLTMVHKHSPDRFAEAVSLVLALQIRNITIGDERPNKYEKQWPTWANLARRGACQEAFDKIRNDMDDDERFRQSFEQARVASAGTARHLLRRLDPISRPGSGVQPSSVDVDHILPKSVVNKLLNDMPLTPKVRRWIEDIGERIPETSEEKEKLGKSLDAL